MRSRINGRICAMHLSRERKHEQGVIITLVAVFMLFVIGAMAALSIDVVTLYTARSEAQLAADAAALAGARVLANSGATSDTTGGSMLNAQTFAQTITTQVAEQNQIGGQNLTAANIVSIVFGGPDTNPTVTVKVQRTDLPTFFARIWGTMHAAVAASATAEAYNPSGASAFGGATPPVAPLCVKPWLLPNVDPTSSPNPIFVTGTGQIAPTAGALLGYETPLAPGSTRLKLACGAPNTATPANCTAPLPPPQALRFYPGDPASFPAPTVALPTCTPALTQPYQGSVAGCIQTQLRATAK